MQLCDNVYNLFILVILPESRIPRECNIPFESLAHGEFKTSKIFARSLLTKKLLIFMCSIFYVLEDFNFLIF